MHSALEINMHCTSLVRNLPFTTCSSFLFFSSVFTESSISSFTSAFTLTFTLSFSSLDISLILSSLPPHLCSLCHQQRLPKKNYSYLRFITFVFLRRCFFFRFLICDSCIFLQYKNNSIRIRQQQKTAKKGKAKNDDNWKKTTTSKRRQ